MLTKSIHFEKRNTDWWVFTLLPIIIIFSISVFIYATFEDIDKVIILLVQQLFFYSLILSSTDLSLRYRSKDKTSPISLSLLIVIFSAFALVYVYIFELNNVTRNFLLIVSLFAVYFSILRYNNNPESLDIDSSTFTEIKEDSERKAKETFEFPKTDTKMDVEWGEQR